MDMYAEHGYIFILFVYKVNRLYIIYIKLAFRDYFFIMRQKKFKKKTRPMVPSSPFIPLLRAAINIKESATKHTLDSMRIKSCGLF